MATLTKSKRTNKSKAEPVVSLVVAIDHVCYQLSPIPASEAIVRGWRMVKAGPDDKVYDVVQTPDGHAECDCPDFESRRRGFDPGGCKHVRALRRVGLIDPMPIVAPAVEPAPCCAVEEPAPCSSCLDARHPEPEAEPAVEPGRDEPEPEPEPEPLPLGLPAELDDDDQGEDLDDDDTGEWGLDDVVGLGPAADPVVPDDMGGRPLTGPRALDSAFWDGYRRGRQEAEAELRDAYEEIARLKAELDAARYDLIAAGQ